MGEWSNPDRNGVQYKCTTSSWPTPLFYALCIGGVLLLLLLANPHAIYDLETIYNNIATQVNAHHG